MRGLFSMDSPFFQFLSRMADLIVLNLIFIVCCVPVITIGPALTALNYVTLKTAAGEDCFIVRSFFKSFRQNFRQALIIWLLMLVVGGALAYNFYTLWGSSDQLQIIILIFSGIAAVGWIMIALYVFPLLAKFDNTVYKTLLNAMVMSVANFTKTISAFMLVFSCALLTFYTLDTIRWGILAWLVIGFSLIAYFNSMLFNKVFAKYIPTESEEEKEEEES